MSGKRKRIQNVIFLNNVSRGFIVHLFNFVRKHLPALRFCFLEMRHCRAGWVKIVVDTAGAPQTCVGLFTVVSLWDITLHSSRAAAQFHALHTRDCCAQFRWHWMSLPSSYRHLLWRSFQNNEAQEWFWDQIAAGHLLPKTTGGLLPLL